MLLGCFISILTLILKFSLPLFFGTDMKTVKLANSNYPCHNRSRSRSSRWFRSTTTIWMIMCMHNPLRLVCVQLMVLIVRLKRRMYGRGINKESTQKLIQKTTTKDII